MTLWLLYMACALTGQHPAECWGTALTESNLGAQLEHRVSTVHGICGVDSRYSPLPAWALDTTAGGALGGALAIRGLKRLHGAKWTSYFVCSRRGVAKRLPACVRAAKKLNDAIARLKARGRQT